MAAIKFVQASLLLRCLAENLNKNQVLGGPNFLQPDGTWNLTLAGMALSWMSEYPRRRKEKHMVDPDTPITGKWTLLE